jgi:hypothetical protein
MTEFSSESKIPRLSVKPWMTVQSLMRFGRGSGVGAFELHQQGSGEDYVADNVHESSASRRDLASGIIESSV